PCAARAERERRLVAPARRVRGPDAAMIAVARPGRLPRRRSVAPPHDRGFFCLAAATFLGSTALTVAWCGAMAAMPQMEMPGGWTMSMAWMRMPGQSWLGAAASFTSMWLVMMVAMMLPSLVPMLRRYRAAVVPGDETRLGALTLLVSLGYFLVWTV